MKRIINNFYKLCLKAAHLYFKFYNFIFRPLTLGVRGIVLDSQNKILPVKHRYDEKWYLPGGQVDKNETLSQALERELKEEVSISFNDATEMEIFGCYSSLYQRKNDHIVLFIVKGASPAFSKDCLEIKEADFLHSMTFLLLYLPASTEDFRNMHKG